MRKGTAQREMRGRRLGKKLLEGGQVGGSRKEVAQRAGIRNGPGCPPWLLIRRRGHDAVYNHSTAFPGCSVVRADRGRSAENHHKSLQIAKTPIIRAVEGNWPGPLKEEAAANHGLHNLHPLPHLVSLSNKAVSNPEKGVDPFYC